MLFKGNSTKLALLIERIHKKDSLDSELHPFRRDGSFSSALSSEGGATSPSSSCPTPTPTGGDGGGVYTLGVTDNTPYQCLYCDKAFQRQNYLKKHQQICDISIIN
ncbi:hypothetical protein M8J75_006623 [Diaphorina citri]|nr:hypothetical protein M8J75_006623 [Diaphorina citri]